MAAFADVIALQVTGIPGDAKFAQNNVLPPDSIRVLTAYFQIRLTEATIASQKSVGNSNAVDAPDSETVEMGYSRIQLLDVETGARACYDIKRAASC